MSELRTNQTMISICEQTANLLINSSYTLSDEEKDCAIRVLTPALFNEICEERKTLQLCSNLKCVRVATNQSKPLSLLKRQKEKPEFLFCIDFQC